MNPEDQLSRLQVREGFALTIDEALRRLECALSLPPRAFGLGDPVQGQNRRLWPLAY
jgi:hypothetical protein